MVPRALQNAVWILLFVSLVSALGFEALTASQQIPAEPQHPRASTAVKDSTSPALSIDQPHTPKEAGEHKAKHAQAVHRLQETSVEFFNIKFSDMVIAVFTIVLAVKTSGLFTETAGLRSAADQQARDMQASINAANRSARTAERALIELEAPFIGLQISEPGFNSVWSQKAQYNISKTWDGLTFNFVNYGRTAAVLIELSDKLELCAFDHLPTLDWLATERVRSYPYGVLVGPDKPSANSYRLFEDFFTVREAFDDIQANQKDMFLVGRLKYRDIFGVVFEMGFSAKFNRATSGFMMEGDGEYNYCKKLG